MATYIDGMNGGKHNSDNMETSIPTTNFIKPMTKLKTNNEYMVWEPGMNEWLWMRYVGYNKLKDEYIFQSNNDSEVFIILDGEDVDADVK